MGRAMFGASRASLSISSLFNYAVIAITLFGLTYVLLGPLGEVSPDSSRFSVHPNLESDEDRLLAREVPVTKFLRSLIVNGTVSNHGRPIILAWTKKYDSKNWWQDSNQNAFEKAQCPYICEITSERALLGRADMVLMQGWKECHLNSTATNGISCVGWDEPFETWEWPHRKTSGQVWVYFSRESQLNTASGLRLAFARNTFNYTISFKPNSDMYFPYGHSTKTIDPHPDEPKTYHAAGKSKQLLWMVSHCKVPLRDNYVRELRKYIGVDEFGRCTGRLVKCPLNDATCVKKFKSQYKFYLAFENSICEHYITEKFWESLASGMVPVVLGPSVKEYETVAPPHSFIHVDNFSSPKALADYLLHLDSHDNQYNAYHSWREHYRLSLGWFTKLCDLCRLATVKPQKTVNLSQWWNMEAECRNYTSSDFIKEVAQSLNNVIDI